MSTNTPYLTGDLTSTFDTASQEKSLALEETRQNFYVSAQMNESDDASIGGLNINQSGRNGDSLLSGDKDKKAMRDMLLISITNDIEAMERSLVEKYGEDFAENLAAEHLDEKTYMRLIAIEDQDERRHQIAIELKQGIDNGTIDADTIFENSDIQEWVEARATLEEQRLTIEVDSSSEPTNEVETYQLSADNSEAVAFDKLF